MLTEGPRPLAERRGARPAARLRRHARAGASRRDQRSAAPARPHRRDRARLHARDRRRDRHRVRPGAGVPVVGGGAARRAEGRDPRIDRRTPHLDPQRAGRLRDRFRVRAAGRRGPADSQLRPRARRGPRVPAVARGHRPRRSRQVVCDAGAETGLFRRRAAPRERDSRRRGRGHHRCAAARPQPHLGRARQGGHLRARTRSHGVRARRQRRLPGGDGHSAARRPRHLDPRHGVERAGDAGERNDGSRAVAGPGSDRQDRAQRLHAGAPGRRRRRRRPSPRARTGGGQRDVPAAAAVRRPVVGRPGHPLHAGDPAAGRRVARRR